MQESNSKIGEIFREAFTDYEKNPSQKVWENIQKSPAVTSTVLSFLSLKTFKLIGIASAFLITAVVVMYFNNSTNDSAISANDNQEIAETNRHNINVPENNLILTDTEDTNDEDSDNIIITPIVPSKERTTNISERNKPKAKKTVTVVRRVNSRDAYNTKNYKSAKSKNTNDAEKLSTRPLNVDIVEDQSICYGEETRLSAFGGETYEWNTGDDVNEIHVAPKSTQSYHVTVTYQDGSQAIGQTKVYVDSRCSRVFVPRSFSPDGDGVNDIFSPSGSGLTNYSLAISTKEGKELYKTNSLNNGWDGYFEGKIVEKGIYTFVVQYTNLLNITHKQIGQFIVRRP